MMYITIENATMSKNIFFSMKYEEKNIKVYYMKYVQFMKKYIINMFYLDDENL